MMRLVLESPERGIEFAEGDYYDISHFADAWMADHLVTDDKKLRKTCDRIGTITDLPFSVLGSPEFIALLRASANSSRP